MERIDRAERAIILTQEHALRVEPPIAGGRWISREVRARGPVARAYCAGPPDEPAWRPRIALAHAIAATQHEMGALERLAESEFIP
jgi:hypothetical protein